FAYCFCSPLAASVLYALSLHDALPISLFCDAGLGNPLLESPPEGSAPYVLPLLVEDSTSLYPTMRRLGFPVYRWDRAWPGTTTRSEEHTSELQSRENLVCRLLLEKKNK